jgi:hypothetical protein
MNKKIIYSQKRLQELLEENIEELDEWVIDEYFTIYQAS